MGRPAPELVHPGPTVVQLPPERECSTAIDSGGPPLRRRSVAAHWPSMMRRSLALLTALFIGGCGGAQTPLGTPDPATATTAQGRFALTFTIDRATVHASDEVVGAAKLTLLTPGTATITGSSDLVIFEFAEVGGAQRDVIPSASPDCGVHALASAEGIVAPIAKSGAVVPGPNADWYRQFLQDPLVHLPAGDWDITAMAAFSDGKGCSGAPYDLRATVRVHVIG
jgi:hypothetical protein